MKNPFMSLWLSGVNRAAGTSTGLLRAAARRQRQAAIKDASEAAMSFWTGGLKKPAIRRRKKKL